tara:strand:- start:8072 stop:8578 length:507 start_codon:yes stop_codon:yes gene_type:complete
MNSNVNDFDFENNLNNQIATMNGDILNHRHPRILIGNHIYYTENGVSSNVPFTIPDNWMEIYRNDPLVNFHSIRICYEYFLISYYRDLERILIYRDNFNEIGVDNINDGGNEINNIHNTINAITDSIIYIGNVYLGVLLAYEREQDPTHVPEQNQVNTEEQEYPSDLD